MSTFELIVFFLIRWLCHIHNYSTLKTGAHLCFLVLSCMGSLSILHISVLPDTSSTDIVSIQLLIFLLILIHH